MERKIDEIDRILLRDLREDAKLSYRKLAEKLRLHPNTLIQRIRKLEEDGVIKRHTIDIDFEKLGYENQVVVLIKTKGGTIGDFDQLKELAKIPEVSSLYGITGNYDVVAMIMAKDRDHLVEVLKRMQKHPIIGRTNSHIILYKYKSAYQFNPFKKE